MPAAADEKDLEASIPLIDTNVGAAGANGVHGAAAEKDLELRTPLSPITHAAKKYALPAAAIIPIWMALSASVILYNNYIFTTLEFKYPVFLVTWHLTFSALGTRVLQRTTNLLDGTKDIHMTREMFVRSILPIGFLMSGSLILSNMAYLHLSVAFIQMLKAFTAVAILLISWISRIHEPNKKLLGIVLMISSGVALASYGEMRFDTLGFVIQCLAICFEASRLVMIEILLHGVKMDPLVSLHYYAPVCAAINLVFLFLWEGFNPFYALASMGPWPLILLSNALVAFGLNVAAVFLIGVGSGLILTLAGVLKDIILVTSSVLMFRTPIAPVQIFGYSIALAGLVIFKTAK
ncbi:TPT-domain-containing protein [Auriculariales sp. MPI-PUGE-AT-0066]|nr:TPT-domain-containing protein [Auriculariales sp. MPI-PUGE-AT-0066]